MPKVIIEIEGASTEVELKPGPNVLGRSGTCQVPIKDASLSREHCKITLAGAAATLNDLGSMNGTSVNGQKVKEHTLRPGDLIKIGKTLIHFERKRGGTTRTKQTRVRPASSPLKDYAVWSKPPLRWIGPAVTVAVLLGLGGGAYALLKLRKGDTIAEDTKNLLRSNPSFEADALGWSLTRAGQSTLSVDADAHDGARGAVIDKAAGPADYIVELAPANDWLNVKGPIEVTAWARSDDFSGSLAARVRFYEHDEGSCLLDATSTPVQKSGAWTQFGSTFTPPAGATAARISWLLIGGSGKVRFDEAKAYEAAAGALNGGAVGEFKLVFAPSGQIAIFHQDRPLVWNLHAALSSKLQGAGEQVFVTAATLSQQGPTVFIKGAILAPTGRAELTYQFDVVEKQLRIGVKLDESTAKLLDDFTLAYTIAGARVKVPRLPHTGQLSSIEIDSGGTGYTLATPIVVGTSISAVGEAAEVETRWSGKGVGEGYVAALSIGQRGLDRERTVESLRAAAEAAEKREQWGAKADAVQKLVGLISDPKESEKLRRELREIQAREGPMFRQASREVYEADLSGDPDRLARAGEAVGRYRFHFDGKSYDAHAQALSDALEAMNKRPRDPLVPPRPDRLLSRAQQYASWGMDFLAREALLALQRRYPNSPEAKEAGNLLTTLKP